MHDHSHEPGGHSHAHSHAPKDFGFAFALGTALNVGFIVIEVIFGLIANSTALLADAGHNLGDVFGLLVAWGAAVLAKRPATERFTYGLRSSSILAALANALLLILACGGIVWEALERFSDPKPIEGMIVIVVAAVGILVNGFTAWLFVSGRKTDLNIRGAYLHMVADAAVSLGVVIAGAVMMLTGWLWLDPVTSLVIVAIVLWSTWGLLRDSINLALAGVPAHIEMPKVKECLEQLPGVTRAHHVHVWGMSTNEVALTAHLVMPGGHPGNAFFKEAAHELRERFGIAHPTLQIETEEGMKDESD